MILTEIQYNKVTT